MGSKSAAFVSSLGALFALVVMSAASGVSPIGIVRAPDPLPAVSLALTLVVGGAIAVLVYRRSQGETRTLFIAPFLISLPYALLLLPAWYALRRYTSAAEWAEPASQHDQAMLALFEILRARLFALSMLGGSAIALGLGLVRARAHLVRERDELPSARSAAALLFVFALTAGVVAASACRVLAVRAHHDAEALAARAAAFSGALRVVRVLDVAALVLLGALLLLGVVLAVVAARRGRAGLVVATLAALAIPIGAEVAMTQYVPARLESHVRWREERDFAPIVLRDEGAGTRHPGCIAALRAMRCGDRVVHEYRELERVVPSVDAARFRAAEARLRPLGIGEPGLHIAIDARLPMRALREIERVAKGQGYLSIVVYGIDAQRASRPSSLPPWLRPAQSVPSAQTWLLEPALANAEGDAYSIWGYRLDTIASLPALVHDMEREVARSRGYTLLHMLLPYKDQEWREIRRRREPDTTEAPDEAEAIRAAIASRRPSLRYCYERALPAHPDLAGRVVLEFEIGLDGRVTTNKATGMEEAQEVGRCVERVVQDIAFAPRRNVARVRYPFAFTVEPTPPR